MVTQTGFAPAYHMNKKHWLTILLNGSVNDDEIYNLLDMSYEMTECAWKAHDGQQPELVVFFP